MVATRRKAALVGTAVVMLVSSACGSRLPQSDIVAAAAVGVQATGAAGLAGGNGQAAVAGNGAVVQTAPSGAPATLAAGGPAAGAGSAGQASGAPGAAGGTAAAGHGGATAAGNAGGASGAGGGTGGGSGGGGASGGGGVAGNAGPATGTPIVLGNIGTYSGPVGAIVVGLQQMLGVWQKWVNAHGGLNGHPVQLIIQDSGGDPSKALAEAKSMVENDHIMAFFNPYLLFEFDAVAKYAASVNIPLIGGDGNAPAWQTTNIAFPETASTRAMSNAGNRYLVSGGAKKLGVVYCVDSTAVCGGYNKYIQETAPTSGGSLAYSAAVSITAPSYTSQCINAQQAGVQGLWLVLDGASAIRMAKDCAAQGYRPKFALVSMALAPSAAAAPELEGSILPSSTFPSAYSGTPSTAAYHQAVQQYAPGLPLSGATASVWAAGALIQAASKYLGANPSTADFFKGLYAIKNNNLGGLTVPVTFTQGGHATDGSCAFMSGIQGGKFTAPNGANLVC